MADRKRHLKLIYSVFVVVQWLLFTLALASVMIRSAKPFELYVSPFLSGGILLVITFLLAFLLSLSVGSLKVTLPLTAAMILGSGTIFGIVLYSPAWAGTLIRSDVFGDYAQEQALLAMLPVAPTAFIGAIAGHFFSDGIQHRIAAWSDTDTERPVSWWTMGENQARDQADDGARG